MVYSFTYCILGLSFHSVHFSFFFVSNSVLCLFVHVVLQMKTCYGHLEVVPGPV